MCGICGFYDPEGQLGIPKASLEAMVGALRLRGPDESGTHYDPRFGLAIARLSIVDVREGHQPYYNEDGTVVAVFNGELYNYPELRGPLLSRGHRLNSRADGEIIVHLYEELGEAFVDRLNGMFAIALMDLRNDKFLLVRDRMGIKPLYYYQRGRGIVFGSQPAALFPSKSVDPILDPASLNEYLTYEFLPDSSCIYRDIAKLRPAHMLTNGGQHRYWQLAPRTGGWDHTPQRRSEEWLDELGFRLGAAVQGQLLSDVPLGMFLSGGVDSSTVTAVAQRRSGGRFKTFSVGFEEASFDESQAAESVAQGLGCQHYTQTLRAQDVLPLLGDLLEGLDEPLADPAVIPTFLLSRLARQQVTVVLSGEGADELFGGYPTYLAHQLAPWLGRIGPLSALMRAALARIPASTHYMSWEFKLKRFFDHVDRAELDGSLRHQLWMGAAEPGLRARLYTPEMTRSLQGRDGFEPLRRLRGDLGPQGWTRFAWQDLQFYLAEGLLVKLDRATMATSLEGRVPYLDHTLVEFALSMPPSLKYRGVRDKWLLRHLAAREVNPQVAWRPKKGFGLPLTHWLKTELRADLCASLDFLGGTGLFERQALSELLKEHTSGRLDRRKELWSLLMLAHWWQRWKPRLL